MKKEKVTGCDSPLTVNAAALRKIARPKYNAVKKAGCDKISKILSPVHPDKKTIVPDARKNEKIQLLVCLPPKQDKNFWPYIDAGVCDCKCCPC